MSTLTLFVTCLVTWLRIFQDQANHCTVYKALCHTRKYGLNILINLMILKDAAPDSRDTIKISHISHPCDKVVRAGLQKSGNFFMTCAKGGGLECHWIFSMHSNLFLPCLCFLYNAKCAKMPPVHLGLGEL